MEKDPIAAWYDSKKSIFKYALKFSVLMLLFYALSETPYCERVFWPANLQANAWLADKILHGLKQSTSTEGHTIWAEQYAFVIKRGCDATEPACLLAAAMVAFSAPPWRKLIGILVGTLLLLGINELRIIALFFVGRDHPTCYETLHLTVLPAIFIILVLILWVSWVKWTKSSEPLKADAKI